MFYLLEVNQTRLCYFTLLIIMSRAFATVCKIMSTKVPPLSKVLITN